MDIYISGSLAYDRIMDFPGKFSDHILPDKIHIINVCFTVNSLVEKFGGTAGNIAYTLNLLQEKATIVATIGKDYENYLKWLKKNKIPTNGIKIIQDEFTASAYITTDKADNQITGFNPGAMRYPSQYDFKNNNSEDTIAIISAGNLRDMIEYGKIFKEKGIKYISDPGQSLTQWGKDELIDWIKGAFILIANDYELELIMKITQLNINKLLNLTPTIITTLGEKGSVIITDNEEININPAIPQEVVDPTGAGDAYRAGLLKGLVMGKDIQTSAKMGSVAAVYAVEKYGTQEHYFTLDEFKQRFYQNYGYMI